MVLSCEFFSFLPPVCSSCWDATAKELRDRSTSLVTSQNCGLRQNVQTRFFRQKGFCSPNSLPVASSIPAGPKGERASSFPDVNYEIAGSCHHECLKELEGRHFYSQGCHAGSMRHKLSGLVAAAIRVVTLVSPPSYWARSEKAMKYTLVRCKIRCVHTVK